MRSGSVDGYVWEALAQVEPDLTGRTRVIARSEPLGFPPFVARHSAGGANLRIRSALLGLARTDEGRAALDLLQLDAVIPAEPALYDGIRARMQLVQGL